MQPLKIGILNVMHDKAETNARFTKVLTHAGVPVELHFYYPKTHYPGGVPESVSRILAPLDLSAAARMDGFIITGAPIEKFAFDDVTYIDEARALMDVLAAHRVTQLYLCWGGMAALDHFYGIKKHMLPHKLFGVYPHHLLAPSSLLQGLPEGFYAAHARYAEMDCDQIEADPRLRLEATTTDGALFLAGNGQARQTFMFAHLEYGQKGLLHEYQREVAAHPDRFYRKPEHYFADPATMSGPQFKWKQTQYVFFDQWVARVVKEQQEKERIL